ncbi:MarR family winged helix-turn-helix transcriptional regulator [Pedobacter cryotolerans]|nr:MarR family transcriptional regulator [Pedobacter cryotolerans]
MNSYQLINQLVTLVAEFEEQKQNNVPLSIENFSGFLNAKLSGEQLENKVKDIRFGEQQPEVVAMAYQLDNNIARLFVYMSRYAKSYIKKALQKTNLATAEDFTCLALLLTHQSLSKTELINMSLLEKASGTEVVNRLLKNNLVHQWDDQNDKRGKRIGITNDGKTLLFEVFTDMNKVSSIITGKLSTSEKYTLQYLLQQLEDFHYDLYTNKSIGSKADLLSYEK